MLTLKPEPDYLTALQVQMIDGILCAMVDCADYDAYQALPKVVSYGGAKLGKTGWNSDTNHAHYQTNALILRVERK